MKIIIEQSGYHLGNMGDLAMLQVAVQRLRNFWPDASVQIFTNAPEKLIECFPNSQPLLLEGREMWLSPLLHKLYKLPNHLFVKQLANIESNFRMSSPSLVRSFKKFKLRKRPELARSLEAFIEAVYSADLVVASGGGYITDVFKDHTVSAIDTIGLANRLGKPTVMLGHGLGPLHDKELLAMARTILPSVNLITLREKRVGVPLLNSIGVSQDRVTVTGDDAIELAYEARNTALANGIGVNLRIAYYSSVNSSVLETLRLALHNVAKKLNAQLIPAPIDHSFFKGYTEPDSATIRQLLKDYDDTSDGGRSLNTPLKVIKQIGKCRVVITGSYHAGVFALSQGIPAICLVKSEYYADKFLGLADQFGVGCEVIFLNDPELERKLIDITVHSWQSSEQLRPKLVEAAKRQIEWGHAAYKRVHELVSSR